MDNQYISLSNINKRVESIMQCFVQNARKTIIDNLETEMNKTDNIDMKKALNTKLTEVIESDDIKFVRKFSSVNQRSPPNEPVRVRDTNLSLKNFQDSKNYRKFCTIIANMLEYKSDFSDAPFRNLPRNARVYEALKTLNHKHNLTQDDLDKIVEECETQD